MDNLEELVRATTTLKVRNQLPGGSRVLPLCLEPKKKRHLRQKPLQTLNHQDSCSHNNKLMTVVQCKSHYLHGTMCSKLKRLLFFCVS